MYSPGAEKVALVDAVGSVLRRTRAGSSVTSPGPVYFDHVVVSGTGSRRLARSSTHTARGNGSPTLARSGCSVAMPTGPLPVGPSSENRTLGGNDPSAIGAWP